MIDRVELEKTAIGFIMASKAKHGKDWEWVEGDAQEAAVYILLRLGFVDFVAEWADAGRGFEVKIRKPATTSCAAPVPPLQSPQSGE